MEEFEKEIMELTEWDGTEAKHTVMKFNWYDKLGEGCDHDDGFFCEHRAAYITQLARDAAAKELQEVLDNGHGGGNFRRLLIMKINKLKV